MSDTVKLIIEIPKPMYEDIKSKKDGYSNYVHTAIRNGTPLDDVKAEIEEEMCLTDNPYTRETKYTIERLKLFEILDNNIGKENEEV